MEQTCKDTTRNPLLFPLTIKQTLYKFVLLPSNKSCIYRLCFSAGHIADCQLRLCFLWTLTCHPCTHKTLVMSGALLPSPPIIFPKANFYIRTWLIRGGMVNLFIYFYFWKVFSSFVGYQRSTQSIPTMFRPRKRGNEIFFFLFLWTVLISVFFLTSLSYTFRRQ